ncbi:MAG: translation initiation inhibitor [Prevotella sp.]|nr:translation initiation inhibitor [Prevotella sp.]
MDQYKIISDNGRGLYEERLTGLYDSVKSYLEAEQRENRRLSYTKVFLSDISNQEEQLRQSPLMTELIGRSACTIIQQSPIGGAKIGLLLKTSDEPDGFTLRSLRLTDDEVMNFGSYMQTVMLFDKYIALLEAEGLNLKEHCVRTWLYVRDIDTNYDGVVKARNDIFRQHGLTVDTHFIASTGIGGRAMGKNVCVAIDFLTARDIRPEDKLYLKALDHLNPTHEYGVAFERGVRVALPTKYEYFISGTASINHRGEVINVGNVTKQTERLLENIGALLADGGATMADVKYFIVYLRDLADVQAVDDYMAKAYPDVPRIITHANVCRPAWLVEMECIAVRSR